MTKEVVFANQFHTFSQVIQLFTEHPMKHLPVVNGHNKVIGILSSNDVLKLFVNPRFKGEVIDMDKLDKDLNLTDLMTPNPVTVRENDMVATATNLIRQRSFQAVPVLNEADELVGMLSIKDLIDFYAEKLEAVA